MNTAHNSLVRKHVPHNTLKNIKIIAIQDVDETQTSVKQNESDYVTNKDYELSIFD